MEGIRKKLTALRAEVDEANEREAQAKEDAAKARNEADRVRLRVAIISVWVVNMFTIIPSSVCVCVYTCACRFR